MSESCKGHAFSNTAFGDLLTELHAQALCRPPCKGAKMRLRFTIKLQPEILG